MNGKVLVAAWIEPAERDALRELAQRRGRSVSSQLRWWITQELADLGRQTD